MNCSSGDHKSTNIIFLHHSTGSRIWRGNPSKIKYKLLKIPDTRKWLNKYNIATKSSYIIEERSFPKKSPYGWNNYPYDYYNIWIKHAGNKPYMEEPTLEMLTGKYDLIIFKHCFPVSSVHADSNNADINSNIRSIENYKLQYMALKEKMRTFPETKFLLWTPAVLVKNKTNTEEAKRIKAFYHWVVNSWDEKGDNIYLWDFYTLETEGGLFLKPEYAESVNNSHPNREFSGMVSRYFANRIIQVLEDKGDISDIRGIEE